MPSQPRFLLLFNRPDKYGAAFNTNDLIKLVAILTMTLDHLSAYKLVDSTWLRVIGHWHVPVWFFLAGYSKSKILTPSLIIVSILLLFASALTTFPVLPVNILLTIIMCRGAVYMFEKHEALFQENILWISLLLVFLFPPTLFLVEYGTAGVFFAFMGYLCRKKLFGSIYDNLASLGFVLYIVSQTFFLNLDFWHAVAFVVGTAVTMCFLFRFERKPVFTGWKEGALKRTVKFLSRNSLYYYFAHRVAFQVLYVTAVLPSGEYKPQWLAALLAFVGV